MNCTKLFSITLLVSLIGCGTWEGGQAEPPPEGPAPATTTTSEPSGLAGTRPTATTVDQAASQPQSVERAKVGLGKKGRGYGGDIVTEPLRTRFRAEDRLRLQTVDYALKLFKAEHGRLPKDHDEFMDKIVRANQIPLPALPAGDEYWYDAEAGQLMVRHARGGGQQ